MERSRKRHRTVLIAATAVSLSGCSPESDPLEWRGTVVRQGDTTVTVTHSGGLWKLDGVVDLEVDELWAGEGVNAPTAIAPLGDSALIIADAALLHIITTSGRHVSTLGRRGAGPGEFQRIGGVTTARPDTIVVWDHAQFRLSWLSPQGHLLRSMPVAPSPGMVNGRSVDLVLGAGHVVLAWSDGLMVPDGPPQEVVLRAVSLGDGSGRDIARITDEAWVTAGERVLVPRAPFGTRALVAISRGGDVAYTDGVKYCINLQRLDSAQVRRFCREWEQRPVPKNVRDPIIPDSVELSVRDRDLLEKRLRVQEIGETMHSIRSLRFDDAGRLWIGLVDERLRYDPMLLGPHPELRPDTYAYDVLGVDGRRLGEVRLASRFRPFYISSEAVYGVYERPTGQRTVARALLRGPLAGTGTQ